MPRDSYIFVFLVLSCCEKSINIPCHDDVFQILYFSINLIPTINTIDFGGDKALTMTMTHWNLAHG